MVNYLFRTIILSMLLLLLPSISHAGNSHYTLSPSATTILDRPASILTVDNEFQLWIPADWEIEENSLKATDSSLTIWDCSTISFKDNDSMRRAHFEPIGTTIKSTKQIHFANLDGQLYELLVPPGLPMDYILIYSLYGDKKNYLVFFTCKADDFTYYSDAIEAIMKTFKPITPNQLI